MDKRGDNFQTALQATLTKGCRELPFGEVVVPAQCRAAVFAMVEHMAKASFEVLAAFAQQRFATLAFDRPPRFNEDLPDDAVLGSP